MLMELEEGSKRTGDIYKNFLSIIVICFQQQNYKQAEVEYQEAANYMDFNSSDEGDAADQMFSALSAASEEEWAECTKHKIFNYLPTVLTRIMRKMTLSEEVIANGPTQRTELKSGGDIGEDGEGDEDSEPDIL